MRSIKRFRPLSLMLVALLLISNISFTLPQAAQAQGLNTASTHNLKSVNSAPGALISLNLTTFVTSTINPSTYSQPVTFRGSIDLGIQVIAPTGSMDFYDGSTKIGTAPLVVTGQLIPFLGVTYTGYADFTTSGLTAGTHSITAIFRSNDLLNINLLATPYNQVVDKANDSISLVSSPNPSNLGQSTSLTATVTSTSPATAIPTGTVTFKDGTTVIGTASLDGTGKAVLNVSSLGGGAHSLTASYNGNTNFNASSPSTPAVSQTVNTGTTTTTLTSSPNPGVFGSAVTFTATISTTAPGSFSKAGTVTFKDGATDIGTAQANTSGVAVFSTSSLTVATHSVTAVYAGNTNFTGSTSLAVSEIINAATGTPTTSTTPNGSLPGGVSYGQPVLLTVHVGAGGGGTPTGTVNYYDNGTLIGTQPLDGSGNATFSTSNLPAGDHTLTATYGGDGTYAPSNTTFTPNPFHVDQGNTTLTVTGPATAPVYGQNASFTVTIADSATGGNSPGGTVTFKDNGTTIGTGTLINGTASFTTGSLGAGSHNITASYAGDTNFTGDDSNVLAFTVNKSSTSALINASSPAPEYGQAEVFTVQVAPSGSGSGTPTGNVVFKDGATTFATVALSNGMASFTTSTLGAGSHSITAEYAGDANFAAVTSDPFAVTIARADTTVSLSSSDVSSTQGGNVTFTATVANTSAPATVPSGTVAFKDGPNTLQTVNLVGGVATYSTTSLTVGTHSITAVYSGTANFNGATSAALSQVINSPTPLATTSTPGTLLTTTPTYGDPVTLSVHVGTGSGTPTGTVSYYDGGTLIGTATLDGSGNATFTTSNLPAGTHNLTAEYNGDGTFGPSTATWPAVTVSKASTTVTVDGPGGTPAYGQPITVTLHVADTATGGNPPSGTVTIKDGGTDIGTASIASDGTATFSTAALGAGSHNITAVYSGDGNFNGNTSTPATLVTVSKANTSVTLTSSATSVTAGSSLTFSAVVTNTSAQGTVPTGTVTFKDGSTTLATITLDSNGMASYNTSSLGQGSHSITATYDGTANFNPFTSPAVTLTITSAGGAPTTSTPGTMTGVFSYGQPVTLTVTVSPVNGGATPTGTVTFYDNNGVPIGQAQLDGTGKATLVTNSLTAGDHNLTASYGGDPNYSQSQTSWSTLNVEMADTTVGLISSASTANAGDSVTFTATVTNTMAPSVVPTGTVTFKDGANTIGTGTLVNGVATLSTTGLTSGSHTITAEYGGTPNYMPGTSSGVTQTINGAGGGACATVNTSVDGNSCGSLRGDINDALTKLATQDVTITISVASIDVDTALPDLANNDGTHTLTLVGLTSTDPNTGRCVAGTSLVKTGNFTGTALVLGNRVNVIGISINGFNGDGVDVNGQNNVLTCMSIGVTSPNTGDGVKITGGNNTLGSATDVTMGNLISNNTGAGIHVLGGPNNAGYHNWVGLNAAGTGALKNGGNALSVASGGQFKLYTGNRFQN